jgi:multiple sugar transport system permease protein
MQSTRGTEKGPAGTFESIVGKRALPYVFLAPALCMILFLLIVPVVEGVFMSFLSTSSAGVVSWVGFDNYRILFRESRFENNMRASLLYLAGVLILSTPLAYGAALLITGKFRQAAYFRGIFLLPWISAPMVSTLLFRALVDPQVGPMGRLVQHLSGSSVVVLGHPVWAFVFIIFHSFWRSFPFIMLFLSAGMSTIPSEIYESAMVDGAGKWKRFTNLTLPLTSNQLAISMLMVTVWTLYDSETIYAFTNGGPGYATETLAVRLFKSAFINFDLNTGAVIGVILIIMSTLFMAVYMKLVAGAGGEGQ